MAKIEKDGYRGTKVFLDDDLQCDLFEKYLKETPFVFFKGEEVKKEDERLSLETVYLDASKSNSQERMFFVKFMLGDDQIIGMFMDLTQIIPMDYRDYVRDYRKGKNDEIVIKGLGIAHIKEAAFDALKAYHPIVSELVRLEKEITPKFKRDGSPSNLNTKLINEKITFLSAYMEIFKINLDFSYILENYKKKFRSLILEYAGQDNTNQELDYKNILNLFLLIPFNSLNEVSLTEILKHCLVNYFKEHHSEKIYRAYNLDEPIKNIFDEIDKNHATKEWFKKKKQFYLQIKKIIFPNELIPQFVLEDPDFGDNYVNNIEIKQGGAYRINGENKDHEPRYIDLNEYRIARGYSGKLNLGIVEGEMASKREEIFSHFGIVPRFKFPVAKRYIVSFLEETDFNDFVMTIEGKGYSWIIKIDNKGNCFNLMPTVMSDRGVYEEAVSLIDQYKDSIFLFYFNKNCPINEINISQNIDNDELESLNDELESSQDYDLQTLITKNSFKPGYIIKSKWGDISVTAEKNEQESYYTFKGKFKDKEDSHFQIAFDLHGKIINDKKYTLSRSKFILYKNRKDIFRYFFETPFPSAQVSQIEKTETKKGNIASIQLKNSFFSKKNITDLKTMHEGLVNFDKKNNMCIVIDDTEPDNSKNVHANISNNEMPDPIKKLKLN